MSQMRKLKYHEQKLLKKTNFLEWKRDDSAREAAILHRYANYKGYDVSVGEDTNILSFDDAQTISGYAVPAMQWACGAGLMQGSNRKLLPTAEATRAQVAAMLHRFLG